MDDYPKAAVERAMKVQEVIFQSMAKKITSRQAAEVIVFSDRQMRRWRERYEEQAPYGGVGSEAGCTGRSTLRHFYEKLGEEHGIG